jgi:hypothetical protein
MLSAIASLERKANAVVIDRRDTMRVILNMGGRYMLSSRRDAQGNRREYACRAVDMSTRALLMLAPVIGPVGERVIAYFGEFGTIDGKIIRTFERGFVMSIDGSEVLRDKIAAKLAWIEDHRTHDIPDGRSHRRIVPRRPFSVLTLASGATCTCLVMDLSISGAAVSADVMPPVGAVVAVGSVIGRVCRHFAEGFAIAFEEVQVLRTLQERLMRTPG